MKSHVMHSSFVCICVWYTIICEVSNKSIHYIKRTFFFTMMSNQKKKYKLTIKYLWFEIKEKSVNLWLSWWHVNFFRWIVSYGPKVDICTINVEKKLMSLRDDFESISVSILHCILFPNLSNIFNNWRSKDSKRHFC